jgi:hypothetical protein
VDWFQSLKQSVQTTFDTDRPQRKEVHLMGVKSRLSHDQKRKAKLAERAARKQGANSFVYEGKKYRAPEWAPFVFRTETAVYETLVMTDRTLTNKTVWAGFVELTRELQAGRSPIFVEGEPDVALCEGKHAEFLIWNIRRAWTDFFASKGPVATNDLIGIIGTLLYSMKAHAWNTGPSLGYLHFLEGFMRNAGVDVRELTQNEFDNLEPFEPA